LAKILFSEVNPSGKLPISWEQKLEDNPTYKNYFEAPNTRDVKYAEGIFLGYRYYDQSDVKPLFPFGFGLSYTSFAFSNLTVTPETASQNDTVTIGFDVKNTGARPERKLPRFTSATLPLRYRVR
jgi:beta-glucosidase